MTEARNDAYSTAFIRKDEEWIPLVGLARFFSLQFKTFLF